MRIVSPDHARIYAAVLVAPAGVPVCDQSVHDGRRLIRLHRRDAVLWAVPKDGDRPRRADRQAVFALPEAAPSKLLKVFYLYPAILSHRQDASRADLHTHAAAGTPIFIHNKLCLIHTFLISDLFSELIL